MLPKSLRGHCMCCKRYVRAGKNAVRMTLSLRVDELLTLVTLDRVCLMVVSKRLNLVVPLLLMSR